MFLFRNVIFCIILFLTSGMLRAASPEQTTQVKIYSDSTYQEIHNFGASDAWSCQYAGLWPDEQRNRIADLLFSLETGTDGTPKGIGLSCWRFNIGAGSASQGDNSGIDDKWRRAESFLLPDGTYDWKRQEGQRWFLKAAKERGTGTFIGFVNSSPIALTKNGKAHSDNGNSMNLRPENLPAFSKYLVEVTANIHKNEGILFDYLSPVNEPQWDWKGGQEGSPWRNNEVAELCRILGPNLKEAGLSTQIEITEAGQLNHLYEAQPEAERGNQIREFFSPTSANYVGDVPNMAHKIAAHSYFTTTNDKVLESVRTRLRREIMEVDADLEFWMSEFCVLGNNDGFTGNGRDLGMETALFVANIIHADLTIAGASAWHWWLAVSPYDFKDGLVYIDKHETGGNIYESKLLWALGNYSRFIRPGATVVKAEPIADSKLKLSAFKNSDGSIVVVVLNPESKPHNLTLSLDYGMDSTVRIYETSATNSLGFMGEAGINDTVTIAPESVTTLVL